MIVPASLFIPVFGAAAVFVWRLQETTRPLSAKKIWIPPLAMSTGTLMFLYSPTRVPLWWAVSAFAVGALLLAVPMIRTSHLKKVGDQIFLTRSKAFLWVLLALVALRFGLRSYVEQHLSLLQTGSIFYLMAWGMILRWRYDMWGKFQAQLRGLNSPPVTR